MKYNIFMVLYVIIGAGSLCLLEIQAVLSIVHGNPDHKSNAAIVYLMPILLLVPLSTGVRSYRMLMRNVARAAEGQTERKSVRFAIGAIVAMAYVLLVVQLTTLS